MGKRGDAKAGWTRDRIARAAGALVLLAAGAAVSYRLIAPGFYSEMKVAVLKPPPPSGSPPGAGGPVEFFLDTSGSTRRSFPSEVNRLDRRGLALLEKGRFEEAAGLFARSLERAPRNPRALANLGTASWGLGRLERALEGYRAAARLDPGLEPVLFRPISRAFIHRGRERINAKDAEGALQDLRTAIELNPKSAAAHSLLASVAILGRKFNDCLEHLDRALELDAGLPGAYGNRGACLSALGRHNEALADLDRAVRADPGRAEIYATRAGVRLWLKDYRAALEDVRKAQELDARLEKTLRPLRVEIERRLKQAR